MIYLLISCIILSIILFSIYIGKNIKMSRNLEPVLNIQIDNIHMCKEMLKIIKNDHTKVQYNKDENSNLSYYNHTKDVIILKSSDVGSSRIAQIAHECIHTSQKKEYLDANKFFSNLQLIYFLASLIYLLYNEQFELVLISIQLLILIGTLFVKVVIEGDASYRSVDLAEEYLLTMFDKEKVENYISKIKPFIYNLMPIYYYNFLLQGIIMVIINLIMIIVFN